MATLTDKGKERLALLEEAERSGKITPKGMDVLSKLREVSGQQPQQQKQETLKSIFSDVASKPGVIPKAWESLTIPERVSKIALPKLVQTQSNIQNKLAQLTKLPIQEEPTGNMARDIIANTPRIMGETASEFVPTMINRSAIVTAGLLEGANVAKYPIKALGKTLAPQLESLSGAAPGSLAAEFKNPLLMFKKSKKAASELYEAGKEVAGQVQPELVDIPRKLEFVQQAAKMAEEGKLNPTSALEARKELDALKKSVTGEFFRNTKNKLDKIAKTVFSEADIAHREAVQAESLRNVLPQNKMGGASSFKTGILAGLQAMKSAGTLPRIAATAAQISMSPLAMGTAAGTAGTIAKVASPVVANAIPAAALVQAGKVLTEKLAKKYLRKAKGDKEAARQMAEKDGYSVE